MPKSDAIPGSETDLKAWMKERLEAKAGIVFPIVAGMMQEAGWPDCYFAHPRISGWYETKHGSNPLSALQQKRIRELTRRSVFAVVVRSVRVPTRLHGERVVPGVYIEISGGYGPVAGSHAWKPESKVSSFRWSTDYASVVEWMLNAQRELRARQG